MFQSKDPEMGYMGLAMSMNGYSYVHGNPINLTDPSGRLVFLPILAGMAVGAVSGAFMGGLLSAGITLASMGKSLHCLSPSEWGQVLVAGLEGAITGAISGALTGPIGFLGWTGSLAAKASILALGVDLGLGVAWDMAVHKTPPGEALVQNIAGQLIGEAAGHVAGRALRAAVNDAGVQAVGIVLGVTAQRASASLKNAWRSVSGSIGDGLGRAWRGAGDAVGSSFGPIHADFEQAQRMLNYRRLQAETEGWVAAEMRLSNATLAEQGESSGITTIIGRMNDLEQFGKERFSEGDLIDTW